MPSKITGESNAYQLKLKRLIADGKLTGTEADRLIREVRTGALTEIEAHYLAGFIDQHRDQFEPEARTRLVDLLTSGEIERLATLSVETGRTTPLRLPTLTPHSATLRTVHWAQKEGSLVVDGFGPDDPMQGQVGDCYFISSLVVVASTRPDLLANAVVDHGDGTYTVTFHSRPVRGLPTQPVEVTVDNRFAFRRAQPEYAAARDPEELWPLVFEKAYAAWKGGYDRIDGGMAANALEALTGGTPDFFLVSTSMKADDIFAKLQLANQKGGCVVALSKPETTEVDGVVADHAYSVLGAEVRGGVPSVKLRNPWGSGEPGRGRDDGIFWLPMSKFLKAFSTVETMSLGAGPAH